MPVYVTFREGPTPSRSVPLLVVSDDRLVDALIEELLTLTDTRPLATTPRPLRPSVVGHERRTLGVVMRGDAAPGNGGPQTMLPD
jgi:hypothetical protein